MTPVPDEAMQKLADAKAILDELVDPFEFADRIGAEARDAMLCFDKRAYERVQDEAVRAGRAQHRLKALWLQAKEAVHSGNSDRVLEIARAIRRVAEIEFSGEETLNHDYNPKEES